MDYKNLSESQKQELIKDACEGAILQTTYEDAKYEHLCVTFGNPMPNLGVVIHYITRKSDGHIAIDISKTVKANGYNSVLHYLNEKPYMVDPLLDGINNCTIVI